jgi:hypothetical protein
MPSGAAQEGRGEAFMSPLFTMTGATDEKPFLTGETMFAGSYFPATPAASPAAGAI